MKEFDKYEYYQKAVQSPDADSEFMARVYRELRDGKEAKTLVEDFCAAFALCCEWVKLNENNDAIGIDLDPEPVGYGRENYLTELNDEQQSRVKILEANVMEADLPKGDIIAALNFSYNGFKDRPTLLEYFKSCYNRLGDNGLLILDTFGGPGCMEPNEHETEHEGYSYYWDQDSYHPLTNHAQFYIHFKRDGEKKREKVFSYDWRLWSIAELKDLLADAGFNDSVIYWEGTDEDGDGDGEFSRTEEGEQCESYVAYVIGRK